MLHAEALMPNVCHVLCSAIFEHEPAAVAALAAKFMIAFTGWQKRQGDAQRKRGSYNEGSQNSTF